LTSPKTERRRQTADGSLQQTQAVREHLCCRLPSAICRLLPVGKSATCSRVRYTSPLPLLSVFDYNPGSCFYPCFTPPYFQCRRTIIVVMPVPMSLKSFSTSRMPRLRSVRVVARRNSGDCSAAGLPLCFVGAVFIKRIIVAIRTGKPLTRTLLRSPTPHLPPVRDARRRMIVR